jgi:2-hydroxychromene-2-carboxylate isomerase
LTSKQLESSVSQIGSTQPGAAPVLYLDLGSPYAYLALERAARVLGEEPRLEPVLLGAIFARRGFGSWSGTDARAGRVAEIEQRAGRYGLPPLRWPAAWPADGLMAMRGAVWAARQGVLAGFARAVFRREFAEGADISAAAVLRECAALAGLDGNELERAVALPEIKQELREATERAWAAGVRGVPSLRVGAAVFYGDDRLELAAAAR